MRLILLCVVVMLAGCTEEPLRCIDGKVMAMRGNVWVEAGVYGGRACKENER